MKHLIPVLLIAHELEKKHEQDKIHEILKIALISHLFKKEENHKLHTMIVEMLINRKCNNESSKTHEILKSLLEAKVCENME